MRACQTFPGGRLRLAQISLAKLTHPSCIPRHLSLHQKRRGKLAEWSNHGVDERSDIASVLQTVSKVEILIAQIHLTAPNQV